MEAIVEGEEFMKVNKARCIGCGLCLTSCPEDAVSLQMKAEVEAPPADWDETMALSTHKGFGQCVHQRPNRCLFRLNVHRQS